MNNLYISSQLSVCVCAFVCFLSIMFADRGHRVYLLPLAAVTVVLLLVSFPTPVWLREALDYKSWSFFLAPEAYSVCRKLSNSPRTSSATASFPRCKTANTFRVSLLARFTRAVKCTIYQLFTNCVCLSSCGCVTRRRNLPTRASSSMRSVDEMATSHILSAIDPIITGSANTPTGGGMNGTDAGSISNGANTGGGGGTTTLLQSGSTVMGRGAGDRSLSVTLDDRDLWLRFQNLTNEMIVTKNGRYVQNASGLLVQHDWIYNS